MIKTVFGNSPNHWLVRLLVASIMLAASLFIIPGCTHETSFNNRANSTLITKSLDNNWLYRWGDSPYTQDGSLAWATPSNLTSDAWEKTASPSAPPNRNGNNNLWLATRLPTYSSHEGSLWLTGVDQSMEIFLDGKKIYSFGDIDTNGIGRFSGYPWHIIDLPPGSSGKPIIFRIWSGHMNIGLFGEIHVSSRDILVEKVFVDSLNNFAIGAVLLFMGIVSLAVFLASRKDRAFLYFSLHALLGLYLISRLLMKFYIAPFPYFWTIAELVSLTLGAAGIIGFAEFVLGPTKWQHCHYLARAGLAGAIAVLIAGISRKVSFVQMLIPVQLYCLVVIFFSIVAFIPAFKKRVPGLRILCTGVFFLALASFIDVAIELRLFWPSLAGRLLFLPWGDFAFISSMGAVLMLRYSEVNRRVARLKRSLEIILSGTKEMATIYEKYTVIRKAIGLVTSEIKFGQAATIDVILTPKEPEGAFITYRICHAGAIPEIPVPMAISETEQLSVRETLQNQKSILTADTAQIPVSWGEKKIGVVRISTFNANEFKEEAVQFTEAMASSLAIAISNIDMLAETEIKTRMETELEAARAIQEQLLPPTSVFPGVEIVHTYRAADSTGGDWLGYFYDRTSHRLNCYVGDVTGHGIAASLITGVICGGIYSAEEALTLQDVHSGKTKSSEERLETLAHILNRLVSQTGKSNLVATMAFLSLDLKTGHVAFLNAGHTCPMIMRSANQSLQTQANAGSRLGSAVDPKFNVRCFQLSPGDSMFIYTDGLLENHGPEKTILSQRKLKEILTSGKSLQEISKQIEDESKALWGEACQDDVTTLFIQWKGPTDWDQNSENVKSIPGCSPLPIEIR
jgi:serine phosphatase RsbU (regulator of sigma subunit)